MSKEREDSFTDDPLEEINLDNDDLDDLLGDAGEEDSNKESSDEADDDLQSSDDLFDEKDLKSKSSDSEAGEENSAEISEEELDSLLAEAEDPSEDSGGDAPADESPVELAEDDLEDATDVLGEDDAADEYPEVPDSLPQDLVSELEEDSSEEDDGGDTDIGGEELLEDSEEEEKPKSSSTKEKKKKGFAAKGKTDSKKAAADMKKSPAAKVTGKAKGETIDFICSECYSELALSATWSEDLVTCPECFHVGKKPDDSFLRTVSTAKAREGKKARLLTILTLLVISSFAGFVFLKSAYGNAAALTAADRAPLQAEVDAATSRLTDAKTRNAVITKGDPEDLGPLQAKVASANEGLSKFTGKDLVEEPTKEKKAKPDFFTTPLVKHNETVDLWEQICLYGGLLFLLLLIWQACVYEGNRWEAYF